VAVDFGGDGEVKGEDLGQQVVLGIEAVGVEDGGIEGSVGVPERVLARQLQRAVERPTALASRCARLNAVEPRAPLCDSYPLYTSARAKLIWAEIVDSNTVPCEGGPE
jgi:hypothetical protein